MGGQSVGQHRLFNAIKIVAHALYFFCTVNFCHIVQPRIEALFAEIDVLAHFALESGPTYRFDVTHIAFQVLVQVVFFDVVFEAKKF